MGIGLFENLSEASQVEVKSVLKKTLTKRKAVDVSLMKKSTNINTVMAGVQALTHEHLSKYEARCEFVTDPQRLRDYIESINTSGYYAIDTETMGLNPMLDDIVGFSLYTPSEDKAIYVPLTHIDIKTLRHDVRQMSKAVALELLNEISAKAVMHNCMFDLRVLKHQLGFNTKIYWDTMIFNKLFTNGKEVSSSLKNIYSALKGDEQFLSFDKYFGKVTFNLVPIQHAYVYASMDALMTWEIYQHQLQLIENDKSCDLAGILSVYRNIEMPICRIVIEMEDAGVGVDLEYCEQLREVYQKKIEEAEARALASLKPYEVEINEYRLEHGGKKCKLSDPIKINSPIQIAILLYDIMKVGVIDNKTPRGTSAGILEKVKNDFTRALLDVRENGKLLSTYIEALPKQVNPNTNRIHTQFNPLGAVTGRFSSESPNLQNIPSANKDIRKIFKAREGYCFISCDYSSQEPRIVSQLSNDPIMINAFTEGKDYYATLGAAAYHKKYEECRETDANGNPNPAGKKIRERAKRCYLGLCYGMQARKLGETLGVTVEEAVDLRQRVLKASPGLKMLLDDSVEFARRYGYVETIWGRRRYLPAMELDMYEFTFLSNSTEAMIFDPIDFSTLEMYDKRDEIKEKYLKRLENARGFKQVSAIMGEARAEGISIKDNSGVIAEAERQAINTRVQGSAADMTKLGMINIYKNKELRDLGFKMLLAVHDELIGECPIENAKRCGELMSECMLAPVKDFVIPFKCDCEFMSRWGERLDVA